MSRPKCGPEAAPAKWVQLLVDAHHDLERVQLLWRYGRVPYRPVVPANIDLDKIESEQDWIDLETDETNFKWKVEDGENPVIRRQKIEEIVENLWKFAVTWTQSHEWSWCDFQLVGYDDEDQELFAQGRRCKLQDEPEKVAPVRGEVEHPSWRKFHTEHTRGLEDIIGFVRSDRDDAVRRSKQMLDDNHVMWSQASAAVREGLQFQREQLDAWKEHYSGRLALKTAALRELERTHRIDRGLQFGTYVVEALLSNLGPFIDRGLDLFADFKVPVFPEFKTAQQAMVYLVNTFTETQLMMLMAGDRDSASAFLGVLLKASKVPDEREALQAVMKLIGIFRSKEYKDVAGPEQQMAGRVIMNRLALYKLTEYDEDE